MMKTILCLALASTLATAGFAQKSNAWIKGGLNLANVSTTSDGRIDEANMLPSFHVGLMGDIPIGGVVALQPGLLFTGKGSKTQTGNPGDNYYFKATSNPLYVEVPLNLIIKLPMAKETNFFFGAGPYAAIGVAGKNKSEGEVVGVDFSGKENIKFSDDDPTTLNNQEGAGLGRMRRFDFGLNGTVGLQLNSVLFSVNYGHGLTKINSVAKNDDDKNKHRVFSFSLGFRL
ncbi:MAG: PorT family protein [Gemmatimonadaceae bacterium]|nr:PorT family protein [Chitinophagaceae bacterium]